MKASAIRCGGIAAGGMLVEQRGEIPTGHAAVDLVVMLGAGAGLGTPERSGAHLVAGVDQPSDRSAIEFARGFYDALANGRSPEFAFAEGRVNLQLLNLPDADVPVFYQLAKSGSPRTTQKLERTFSVFITGANSVGKTTVANHLARRFGFEAIIPADALRAGLRPWAQQIGKPELLWSSFEVADHLNVSVEEGFERQCAAFCTSFEAVLQHSRRKRARRRAVRRSRLRQYSADIGREHPVWSREGIVHGSH